MIKACTTRMTHAPTPPIPPAEAGVRLTLARQSVHVRSAVLSDEDHKGGALPKHARTPGSGPILVTGVPRSGTTWLARQLAQCEHSAMTGREPMNPRGRQYALGGTLGGWARLTQPTPKQQRRLRLAYRGLLLPVYSRYGHRQWAAPLPWTRVIVKDPFATLSIPAIARETGATVVLVYRHPGAILSSYRRMGWTPDLKELDGLIDVDDADPDVDGSVDPVVGDMARFWAALNRVALEDALATPHAFVVSHEALTTAGPAGVRALAVACGLTLPPAEDEPDVDQAPSSVPARGTPEGKRLHDFDRAPQEVAHGWRGKISDLELAVLEHHAGETLARLQGSALSLT